MVNKIVLIRLLWGSLPISGLDRLYSWPIGFTFQYGTLAIVLDEAKQMSRYTYIHLYDVIISNSTMAGSPLRFFPPAIFFPRLRNDLHFSPNIVYLRLKTKTPLPARTSKLLSQVALLFHYSSLTSVPFLPFFGFLRFMSYLYSSQGTVLRL